MNEDTRYFQDRPSGFAYGQVLGPIGPLSALFDDWEAGRAVGLGGVTALLFCGPAGSGTSALLRSVAGACAGAGYGCTVVHLTKEEHQLSEGLSAALKAALPERPCCLILHNLERLSSPAELETLLNCAARGEHPFVVAAAAEDESRIDPWVSSLFTPVFLTPPDSEAREQYFGIRFPEMRSQDRFAMVEKTQGYRFAQLAALDLELRLLWKSSLAEAGDAAAALAEAVGSLLPRLPPAAAWEAAPPIGTAPLTAPHPAAPPELTLEFVESLSACDFELFPDHL